MSSLCGRPRSPALEVDDLLFEILLRLPPQPSSLPRASLVCKRWHGLASDPGFSRRFRRHHRRSPPLLGFFIRDGSYTFAPTLEAPNSIPRGRFSLKRVDGYGDIYGDGDGDGYGYPFMYLGCRHGLVLITVGPNQMLVWDPVTDDEHRVAIPPGIATHARKKVIHGAVLRTGGDAHFMVVLSVADKLQRQSFACVYSSETSAWGDLISTPLPSLHTPTSVCPDKPAVLAGNSLYWMLDGTFCGILEFDLEKQSLAVIRVPVHMLGNGQFWIVRAEGGGLGLLFLAGSSIQLWKRKTVCDGVVSWALRRTIELDKLLSLKSRQVSVSILGLAEVNNVVFLWTDGAIFMVHLESLQFKKLIETNFPCHYHPFECIYTTETGIGG